MFSRSDQSIRGLSSLRRPRLSFGTCAVAMLLAGALGYKMGAETLSFPGLSQTKVVRQQLSQLQRKYNIEVEAKKNLAEHLKSLQQQHAELANSMSLFQNITGMRFNQTAVKIKAFQVFPSANPNTYRYLVVLAKERSGDELSTGSVALTIQGKIGEQSILLPVKYVNSGKPNGLGFKFRHFQELNGELSFPDRFVPEEIHFKVMADNNMLPVEQTIPWRVV